jgi:1-phosphatidylinositol-4-phosphate 5-kinase
LHLKNNPLSLLPKFFGCYQLIRKYKKSKNKINFIVMMNVFKTSRYIHIRFDLKGSKIGRKVLSNNKKKNEDILKQGDLALKDLDLEEKNIKTYIGKNKSELFFNQLKKDVDFLCNVGSIDYSLLLGIHYINRENQIKKKKISKMKSVINKCKSNKDLTKSDINNNNIFRRNNMLHKTKTLAAKKISMNSVIVTNGNDNFFNTYNNKLSFTDINNNNNNKINNIINNNENINNVINTNENNNINNNENNNNNNKSNSFDEDFLSFFEDDDKSYKERLEEVHKLFNFDDGGIISENGNEIIFLGIIDILTEYNCKKSTEHFFKMLRYCSNDMSCVNPIYYKDRFFNYMKKVIMHGDPNIKNRFNKLYYQETTTDNDIKNQFISNDINCNNNVKENEVDIFE